MMRYKWLLRNLQVFFLFIAMIALFSTLSTFTAHAADGTYPVAYSELREGYTTTLNKKTRANQTSMDFSDPKGPDGKELSFLGRLHYLKPGLKITILKRKPERNAFYATYLIKVNDKYYQLDNHELRDQTDHVSIPKAQLEKFLERRKKASERLWKQVEGKPGKEIILAKGAKLTSRPGSYYKQVLLITDKETPAKLVQEVPGYFLVRLWDGKTNQAGWVAEAHLGKAELERIKKERQAKERSTEPLPPNVEPLPHDKLFPGCSLVLRKDLYALTVLDESSYLPPGTRIKILKRAGSDSYPEYQFNIEYGKKWLGKLDLYEKWQTSLKDFKGRTSRVTIAPEGRAALERMRDEANQRLISASKELAGKPVTLLLHARLMANFMGPDQLITFTAQADTPAEIVVTRAFFEAPGKQTAARYLVRVKQGDKTFTGWAWDYEISQADRERLTKPTQDAAAKLKAESAGKKGRVVELKWRTRLLPTPQSQQDDGAVIYWSPIYAKAQILESKKNQTADGKASTKHLVRMESKDAWVGWVDQCDLVEELDVPILVDVDDKKLKPGYKMLLDSPLCLDKSCGASSPLAQPRCLRPGSLLTIKKVLPEKGESYSKVVPYVVSTCRGEMVLDSEKLPTSEVFIPVPEP